MASQDILALARRGHPKVLAAIINQTMQNHGVRSQVTRRDRDLHVLMEADQVPEQQSAIAFIRSLLENLGVKEIEQVYVYGHRAGAAQVNWQQNIIISQNAMQTAPRQTSGQPSSQAPTQTRMGQAKMGQAMIETEVRSPSFPDLAATMPVRSPIPLVYPELEDEDFVNPFTLPPDAVLFELPPDAVLFEEEPFSGKGGELISSMKSALVIDREFIPENQQSFLKRPEAVVLMVMLTLVAFWQLYLDLLEESAETPLTTGQLAQRLNVSRKIIRRKKAQADFSTWTRSLDPEGVAWIAGNGGFVPTVTL